MDPQLAIVIPAYKAIYLQACLESIAQQTDKRFRLYIGDDASPEALDAIILPFKQSIHLIYHRFDQNMGGNDLVGHWERCVKLTQGEPWLWLFSDDDLMDPTCVETFLNELAANHNSSKELYRFDLQVINSSGAPLWSRKPFPVRLSAVDFVDGRIQHRLHSSVVEYIFSRSKFEAVGGFQSFDLAWFSDDATWIKMMGEQGVYTLPEALVYWRFSEQNISSTSADPSLILRKVQSSLSFLQWAEKYFAQRGESLKSSQIQQIQFLLAVPLNSKTLSWSEKATYLPFILKERKASWIVKVRISFYFLLFFAKQSLGLWLSRGNRKSQHTSTSSITSSGGNS
jgi:glycosyltransferase involved in cell wall biosynthesis